MTTRNPPQVSQRPRIDKLGVKPGFRVAVIGVDDEALFAELRERSDQVVVGMPRTRRDIIFVGIDAPDGLDQLEPLKLRLVEEGAIWIVSRKAARLVTDNEIVDACRRAGLVANKQLSFSDSHSATRFVPAPALRAHR